MASEKGGDIIIKKIKKGHGAAHGGAWKVAYADFVTAMMCFFLVMWLMGSDEETRSAVSHYFNNPTSAWRKDLASKDNLPLGDRTGAGESIANGADGATPSDLVERPLRPINEEPQSSKVGETLDSFLKNDTLASLDEIKFSVDEKLMFKEGTTEAWTAEAPKLLLKIGTLAKQFKGKLEIRTSFKGAKERSPASSDVGVGSYEFQMARAVAVEKYIVEKEWLSEDHISSKVKPESSRSIDSDEPKTNGRRIEFILNK